MIETPPAGGPLATIDFQSKAEGYRRYSSWRQGELAMRQHESRGTAQQLDLQLLVNLKSFETIDIADLAVTNVSHRNAGTGCGGLGTLRRGTSRPVCSMVTAYMAG